MLGVRRNEEQGDLTPLGSGEQRMPTLLVSPVTEEPFSSTTAVCPKSCCWRSRGRAGPRRLGLDQPGEASQQELRDMLDGGLGHLLLNMWASLLSAHASQADATLKVL